MCSWPWARSGSRRTPRWAMWPPSASSMDANHQKHEQAKHLIHAVLLQETAQPISDIKTMSAPDTTMAVAMTMKLSVERHRRQHRVEGEYDIHCKDPELSRSPPTHAWGLRPFPLHESWTTQHVEDFLHRRVNEECAARHQDQAVAIDCSCRDGGERETEDTGTGTWK